ncbi:hypothetical protein CSC17_2215 [Klebsiella oxytoca]|nr:hypothetical protein CSC17_2215 [Klebsiella oxytoca]
MLPNVTGIRCPTLLSCLAYYKNKGNAIFNALKQRKPVSLTGFM